MTRNERIEKAMALRAKGYNCAQSVVMVFPELSGLDDATAARVCNALGAGVAATGEVCGVANAIAILSGLTRSDEPTEKVAATKIARPLIERFKSENGGRIRCADLKSKDALRPCNELIVQGIGILDEYFK